jgi:HAD superfamily hydrolase (TIGR01509 family)
MPHDPAMIFPHQPPDTTRPDRDVLLPSAAAVVSLLAALGLGAFAGWLTMSYVVIATIGACLVGAIAWALPYLYVRVAASRVHGAVSAATCHDRFLHLALRVYASPRRARRHKDMLAEIATYRKHPNYATLQDVHPVLFGGMTNDALERTRGVLEGIRKAKQQVRDAATRHLAAYLRPLLQEDTTLVLYGFSTTACDAVRALVPFPDCKVVVLEDQQYGEASQREHEAVVERIKTVVARPRVIAFKDVSELLAAARDTTVRALDGSVVTRAKRKLVILLGCEVYTTSGSVLIPSRTTDPKNDTGTFLSAIQTAYATAPQRIKVIVAAESYKLQEQLTRGDERVAAPFVYSLSNFRRLVTFWWTGQPAYLAAHMVDLVRLEPPLITAIIDEHGQYERPLFDGLVSSRNAWASTVRARYGPEDLGFAKTCEVYIFDVSSVLLDDESDHHAAFSELVHLGRGRQTLLPFDYNRWCLGKSDREGVEALKRAKKLTGNTAHLVERKRQIYGQKTRDRFKVYNGAVELLHCLTSLGKHVYLVTAASRSDTDRFLRKTGLASVITRAYTDVATSKRHAIYKAIVRKSGVDPHATVVVDNLPANIEAAQGLHLRTIGVRTTHSESIRADQVVDDVAQLLRLIKQEEAEAS